MTQPPPPLSYLDDAELQQARDTATKAVAMMNLSGEKAQREYQQVYNEAMRRMVAKKWAESGGPAGSPPTVDGLRRELEKARSLLNQQMANAMSQESEAVVIQPAPAKASAPPMEEAPPSPAPMGYAAVAVGGYHASGPTSALSEAKRVAWAVSAMIARHIRAYGFRSGRVESVTSAMVDVPLFATIGPDSLMPLGHAIIMLGGIEVRTASGPRWFIARFPMVQMLSVNPAPAQHVVGPLVTPGSGEGPHWWPTIGLVNDRNRARFCASPIHGAAISAPNNKAVSVYEAHDIDTVWVSPPLDSEKEMLGVMEQEVAMLDEHYERFVSQGEPDSEIAREREAVWRTGLMAAINGKAVRHPDEHDTALRLAHESWAVVFGRVKEFMRELHAQAVSGRVSDVSQRERDDIHYSGERARYAHEVSQVFGNKSAEETPGMLLLKGLLAPAIDATGTPMDAPAAP